MDPPVIIKSDTEEDTKNLQMSELLNKSPSTSISHDLNDMTAPNSSSYLEIEESCISKPYSKQDSSRKQQQQQSHHIFSVNPKISNSLSSGNIIETMNLKSLRKGGDTCSVSSNSSVSNKHTSDTSDIPINFELVNDDGENDAIEIDIADSEKVKEDDKSFNNARRKSISDRLNKRRTSELAAEIIRLSAEHRKKEFYELLTEHEEIVKGIELWKTTGVFPVTDSSNTKRDNLNDNNANDDDDVDDDDIIDEEPELFLRQKRLVPRENTSN